MTQTTAKGNRLSICSIQTGEAVMLYYAFGSLMVALMLYVLDLVGLAPGAAGFGNLLLLTSVVLVAIRAWYHSDRRFGYRRHHAHP